MSDDSAALGAAPNRCDERGHDCLNSRENCTGHGVHFSHSDKGTPQGGVISPLLANLYLHWMDQRFHGADGPARFAGARLVRYRASYR